MILTVPEIGGWAKASHPTCFTVWIAILLLEVPIEEELYPVLWSDNDPWAIAIAEALSAVYFLAWATYNLFKAVS